MHDADAGDDDEKIRKDVFVKRLTMSSQRI
jgi:hypothetical protein